MKTADTTGVRMNFKQAVRTRSAVMAGVAAVALGVGASPALAHVRTSVAPAVRYSQPGGHRTASLARGAERFRGRYQLRLNEAGRLVAG